MRFGSLFTGIGGIDLGLERAGMECAWQVEIDDYATKVLEKHWPSIARFRDVRSCGKHNLTRVDLIAGGFPCQDISSAGRRAGIDGERSGLWAQFHRIIRELRPRYVLVENVAALLYPIKRDGYTEPAPIARVLGDLAASGYDAEWQVLPAAAFGAPHLRERVFIVAYATGGGLEKCQDTKWVHDQSHAPGDVPNAISPGCSRGQHESQSRQYECAPIASQNGDWQPLADSTGQQREWSGHSWPGRTGFANSSEDVADPAGDGWHEWRAERERQQGQLFSERGCSSLANPDRQSLAVGEIFGSHARKELTAFKRSCSEGTGIWAAEPDLGRVANGVPARVDRLRGLGNAVVPQVAEYIGKRILSVTS